MRLVWVALIAAACSSKQPEPVAPPGSGAGSAPAPVETPIVTDGDAARTNAGKSVAVQGTARNAKLAAAIVATNLVVYCLGLDGWPSDVSGKPITARGKLEETQEFAAPADGTAAGTEGAVWVLRDCQYDAK